MRLRWRDRVSMLGWALKGQFETAPGSVGDKLLRGIYQGGAGESPKRGTREFLQAYTTSPWLRAVESRIAAGTASVQWCLYAVKRKGQDRAEQDKRLQRGSPEVRKSLLVERERAGELVKIAEHPFLTAFDQGVAQLSGLAVRKLIQLYLDLTGDAFLLKERNGVQAPVAFWPLVPDWILDTPSPAHPFFRVSIRGYQAQIPQADVLWITDPDPANPYGRGSGQAMAVGDELDADEYMAKTTRQRFVNGAKPDFLVMPKGEQTMLPHETKRLELDWTNRHQGFWKWFKPMFASREVGIHEFTQDFQALQLTELRKHERDMILQVTGGLPPEMLGIVESSNRATIEAAKYLMDTQVLMPRLELQRAAYQAFMVSDYDERLILDYVNPASDDMTAKIVAMQAAPWAPTVDEWRQVQGFEPLPKGSGKVHMVPLGTHPMDTLEPQDEPTLGDDEVVPPKTPAADPDEAA